MSTGIHRTDPDPAEVLAVAHRAGLDVVGLAGAEPFALARREIERRKAAGLHGGMAFTYRNPVRSTDPSRALEGARSLVVAARSYRRGPAPCPSRPGVHGRVARYSWADHYQPLRVGLEAVADHLRSLGWRARVLVDDNAMVDRAAAVRAGLGWFGKNTVVLLPGRGSWFVLGSVVTDAGLPSTGPPTDEAGPPAADAGLPPTDAGAGPDGCGTCTRCMVACPTGALSEAGVLDARRCLAWLLQAPGDFPEEHRVALGDRIYGCDVCQEVCPVNRRVDRSEDPSLTASAPAPAAGREEQPWVDVMKILTEDDASLMAEFGRWYIPGREARYMRRNALVVLGNVGDGSDPDVRKVLRAFLTGPDDMLRSHAAWAAARLGGAEADLVESG